MANPLEQALNRVKQILSPTASSAMSAAKQGYSNLKGNVKALSNSETRKLWTSADAPISNAIRTFSEPAQQLGRGIGGAIRSPFDFYFNSKNAQIDQRLQNTLRNQQTGFMESGDLVSARDRASKIANIGQQTANRQIGMGQQLQGDRNNAALGTVRTGIQLFGANGLNPKSLLSTMALSGGIGYGATRLMGGSNQQALNNVGSALGDALTYRGINKISDKLFTNPIMSRVAPGNIGARVGFGAGVNALANLGEDEVLAKVGGKKITNTDRAISLATGAAMGGISQAVQTKQYLKQVEKERNKLTGAIEKAIKENRSSKELQDSFNKFTSNYNEPISKLKRKLGVQASAVIKRIVSTVESNGKVAEADMKDLYKMWTDHSGSPKLAAYMTPEEIAQDLWKHGRKTYSQGGFAGEIDDTQYKPEQNVKVKQQNLTQQIAENVTGKRLRVRPSPKVEAPPIKPLNEPDLTGASVSPETSSYLKELNQSQANARQGKSNTLSNLAMDVKRKMIDSVSPIEDIFASNKRSGITVKPSEDFSGAVDRSKRATVLATQFVKDNGLEDVVKNAPDINALDQYLIAKHAPEVSTTTGRNAVRDQQLVAELAPVYEPFAQQVRKYTHSLLDYATESGLISKETNAYLKKTYPDYVPLNRIFAEGELNQKGFSAGPASISKQTVVQKLKGSEREIQSPLSSLLLKTQDAFKQGERNKAGQILANNRDVGGFKGLITPLRTAENVTKRISLYEEAKDLKPVQNKLSRMMITSSRKVRQLKSAINALERKGLDLSLKEKAPKKTTPLTSAIETKTTPNKVIFGTGENADVVVGGTPGKTTLKDKYATSTNRGKQSTKKFIDDLITLPSSDIQALKKKVANKGNKLGPLFDQLQEIQDMYASVKAQRMQMFDEAALLRDAESRGKSTFSIFRNGIKEIYETTPEIASAAKSLDATQLGVVGEILAAPVRVARIGITGINAPFVLANVVKDQVTAAINSDKALKTSVLNAPNFVKALWAALGHGKEYDNWIRSGGGGTSFDITRNAPELSLNRMRAQRNIGSKVAYTVTHPSQMLRAVEDVLARGEELTRIQQFTGTRDALLKEGMSLTDANAAAAKQSRTATINFARSGDWGRTLNSVWLYLNAGIQGGRTLASSLRDRPAQTITKLALVGMTPVAMTTLWNTSDPDRKAAYDDIQEYEKDNNLIIVPNNPVKDPKTGKWNVLKVPLSQEVANLTVPLRHQLEAMSGAPGTNFGEVAASLVGTFTGANLQSPNAFLSQTTPQALKPGLQWGLNKNLFTGNDIVPQYMIDQGLPPEMQVKDNTSGTARIVGKAINQSPLKVEQAVKDVFGGVGEQAINAVDTGLNMAGVIPADQIGGKSIPEGIVGRFNQAAGGQQLNNLYEGKPVTGGLVSTAQASDGKALPPEIVENKGSYYVKIGKTVKSFDTPEEATLAVDKQKFKESDKNIDLIGDTVFRRSKDGDVTTMPKIDYDTLVTTQKMENAKLTDDYKTWMDLALVQAGNIQTQMQDPTLDDLEKGDLQQKLDALIESAIKYQGYGGFKKPKKGKALPKMQVAKFTRPSFKMKRDTAKSGKIQTVSSKKIAPPKIKVSRFKVKKA